MKTKAQYVLYTFLFLTISMPFIIINTQAGYYAGDIINVCGDTKGYDNLPNWNEHTRAETLGLCSGCWDAACSGNLRIYSCVKGQETYQNGAITCNRFERDYNGTLLHINEFQNSCVLKRVEVRSSSGYSDFVIFKGSNFDNPSCSSTLVPSTGSSTGSSTINNGSTRYGSGTYVNVCGDSTPSNDSSDWREHDLNPLCQGCTKDNGCSGSYVEVYKCYNSNQSARENGGLKCEYYLSNNVPSNYEGFSTWFTNSYELVQIDVFDQNGNLKDFVVWRGDNFGNTQPTVTPVPIVTPIPTYTPPVLPQPIQCQRICTDPNNCPFYNPATGQTFPDVLPSNPYFRHIQNLECENVLHGYSDGQFKPSQPITRGEMAKIIENGYRFPENTRCGEFRDVYRSSKFYTYIMTLKCNDVITGYSDGTFRENDLITRSEAMKFIINGARKALGDNYFLANTTGYQVYSDVYTSSKFFDYINASYSNNIIDTNYPTGEFRPNNFISRQEMALYVDKVRIKMEERGWGR